jgi:hypothetical protein
MTTNVESGERKMIREEKMNTHKTEGKRKEAELSASSSTPTRRPEPRTAQTSPLVYARLAGFLVLLVVIIAPFSQLYLPATLIVPGDATATANNIGASGWLFQLGIVSETLVFLIEIVLCGLLYVLFRPVSRTISLISAFARLSMTVVMGINLLPYFIALTLLSGASYLTVFEPAQSDALALVFLNAHGYGIFVWQLFFGFHLAVLGYLIFKSGYFPRILGVLMVFAALGYLIDAYGSNILYPTYAETFGLVVGVGAIFGELPFFLWLAIKGVNVQRYNERAQQQPR